MKTAASWDEILKIENDFLSIEAQISDHIITDYRQIPPSAFAFHGWDMIPSERLFKIILPFLNQTLHRAQHEMALLRGMITLIGYPIAQYTIRNLKSEVLDGRTT